MKEKSKEKGGPRSFTLLHSAECLKLDKNKVLAPTTRSTSPSTPSSPPHKNSSLYKSNSSTTLENTSAKTSTCSNSKFRLCPTQTVRNTRTRSSPSKQSKPQRTYTRWKFPSGRANQSLSWSRPPSRNCRSRRTSGAR